MGQKSEIDPKKPLSPLINSSIDTLTNFDSPSNFGGSKNFDLYDDSDPYYNAQGDISHLQDHFSDRSGNSSPVESYLSYYKRNSRANSVKYKNAASRQLITKSAPVSNKVSSSQYNKTHELGPTNTTIFNEIFTKNNLQKERENLKKQQIDYSKRLRHRANYNLNFKLPGQGHDQDENNNTIPGSNNNRKIPIIEKLRENIDKNTNLYDLSRRTTTRERIERSTKVRNRQTEYAKNNIPKPRVVKKLDNSHISNNSSGDLNSKLAERGLRANNNQNPKPFNNNFGKSNMLTNRSQSVNEKSKGQEKETNSNNNNDDGMDELLFMLARHKREQNALNSF